MELRQQALGQVPARPSSGSPVPPVSPPQSFSAESPEIGALSTAETTLYMWWLLCLLAILLPHENVSSA